MKGTQKQKNQKVVEPIEGKTAREESRNKGNSANKSTVEQFVVELLSNIRTGIADQTLIIQSIIQAINSKTNQTSCSEKEQTNKMGVFSSSVLNEIKSAVDSLKRTSQELYERLFDLNQHLVIFEAEQLAKGEKLEMLQKMFDFERKELEQRILSEQKKYNQLQRKLEKEAFANIQIIRGEKRRKSELINYLQIIESLSEEIEDLRSLRMDSECENAYTTQASCPSQYEPHCSHHYSEKYYESRQFPKKMNFNGRSDGQKVLYRKQAKGCVDLQNNQYYPAVNKERGMANYIDKKEDQVRSVYINISKGREKGQSAEKELRMRSPSYKATIISSNIPKCGKKASEIRGQSREVDRKSQQKELIGNKYVTKQHSRDENKMRKRAEEADLIEEKNERLRTVEEKLHSLKKKLEREVRAMNV